MGQALRVLVQLRIGRVDPVDLRSLDDRVGADLDGAQRARGVGCEERVAGAGGEDHNTPLLQVADRTAPDVRLGDRAHLARRKGARLQAGTPERVLAVAPGGY